MSEHKTRIKTGNNIIQDVVRRPTRVAAPVKINFVVRILRVIKVVKPSRRLLVAVLIVLGTIGVIAGSFWYFKSNSTKHNDLSVFGQPTDMRISIPIYYPQNLPAGYTYNNDAKVLKTNIYYYSLTGPNKQLFHVTQQPVAVNFDFRTFNKKFLTPDTFNADSGTVTAGEVGASTIGSIKTNKNTWIIINSSATNSLTQLETITRSLEPAH